MSLATFARMCEVIENQTPTGKINTIDGSLNSFGDDKHLAIAILSLEYGVNNIAEKRAITWVANALGLFDDEVEDAVHTWGDLGEAVLEIDLGNEEDSDITLGALWNLLRLDCSSMVSNSYQQIAEALGKMSAREKKWFVRYWLSKPRNGVNNNVPLKVLAKHYGYTITEIKRYYQFNTASEICSQLHAGFEPECNLEFGRFVTPMLAKPRKGMERPDNYVVDVKYDGNRYQIHYGPMGPYKPSVLIFNRKGVIVTDQFPDVVNDILDEKVLSSPCIVDTEIYPVKSDGSPADHKLLAKRVHKKDRTEAMQQCPVQLAVFDILSIQGTPLIDEPLSIRLQKLEENVEEPYIAKRFDKLGVTSIESAYNLAIDWGYEGIMIKDADMSYQPGKRSKGWLKYKPPRIELDVVITSAEYGKGKRSGWFGTFGISVKNDADYVEVGKVGTGFSDDELALLTTELRKHIDRYEGDTYYFNPRIVLQVTSDLITSNADGKIGLRFPRCMRVRHDKYPADIDTLQRVQELS
tara:strand:- start:14733 stop:16301 length:1569 start_codon:yes stop_codon:yes gene_type:complete